MGLGKQLHCFDQVSFSYCWVFSVKTCFEVKNDWCIQLTEFLLHPVAAQWSRKPDGPRCIDRGVGLVHVGEVGEAVALLELVHEATAALKTVKGTARERLALRVTVYWHCI